MSLQDELIQANELDRTIANLLGQPPINSANVSQAVDGLIMSLISKAQEQLNPPTVKASSPPAGEAGAGDTAHIHGDSQPLAAYTGHASDCWTNNRGVPELLGPCDCRSCGQSDTGQTGEYPCKTCGVPTTHDAPTLSALTLQSYFEDNLARSVFDFSLRTCRLPGGEVGFYLHPARVDGHTPQFTVKGNALTTHTPA